MDAPIVDAHMHVYPMAAWGTRRTSDHAIGEYGEAVPVARSNEPGDIASARRALARAGAVGLALNLFEPARVTADLADLAVASGVARDGGPGAYLVWLNEWLCSAVAEDPALSPVIAADPRALGPDALAWHVEDGAARGAVAVKLHHAFQGYLPHDVRLAPLYDACAGMGLTVIAHSGPPVPPSSFATMLARWPQLSVVLAHLGGAAWREAPDVARAHANVAFDVSELIWWLGAPRAPERSALLPLLRRIGTERVLFGSDFPWYEPCDGISILASLGLRSDELEAILGANSHRLIPRLARRPVPAESTPSPEGGIVR